MCASRLADRRIGVLTVVKNLSPAGALLAIDSVIGIPGRFVLVIEADLFTRPCRVGVGGETNADWREVRWSASVGVLVICRFAHSAALRRYLPRSDAPRRTRSARPISYLPRILMFLA